MGQLSHKKQAEMQTQSKVRIENKITRKYKIKKEV